MNIGWQELVAFALVVAAAIYLTRRLWRVARGKQPTGCGTCPSCPAASNSEQLISIDPPPKSNYGDNTIA